MPPQEETTEVSDACNSLAMDELNKSKNSLNKILQMNIEKGKVVRINFKSTGRHSEFVPLEIENSSRDNSPNSLRSSPSKSESIISISSESEVEGFKSHIENNDDNVDIISEPSDQYNELEDVGNEMECDVNNAELEDETSNNRLMNSIFVGGYKMVKNLFFKRRESPACKKRKTINKLSTDMVDRILHIKESKGKEDHSKISLKSFENKRQCASCSSYKCRCNRQIIAMETNCENEFTDADLSKNRKNIKKDNKNIRNDSSSSSEEWYNRLKTSRDKNYKLKKLEDNEVQIKNTAKARNTKKNSTCYSRNTQFKPLKRQSQSQFIYEEARVNRAIGGKKLKTDKISSFEKSNKSLKASKRMQQVKSPGNYSSDSLTHELRIKSMHMEKLSTKETKKRTKSCAKSNKILSLRNHESRSREIRSSSTLGLKKNNKKYKVLKRKYQFKSTRNDSRSCSSSSRSSSISPSSSSNTPDSQSRSPVVRYDKKPESSRAKEQFVPIVGGRSMSKLCKLSKNNVKKVVVKKCYAHKKLCEKSKMTDKKNGPIQKNKKSSLFDRIMNVLFPTEPGHLPARTPSHLTNRSNSESKLNCKKKSSTHSRSSSSLR